jgi:hypothetical protein
MNFWEIKQFDAIGLYLNLLLDLKCICIFTGEPGSSGSIVSGYGLDDRTIEVRSPTEEK